MAEIHRQRVGKRRRRGGVIVLGLLLILFAGILGAGIALLPPPDVIAGGVQVAGILLGGMTRKQASAALESTLGHVSNKSLTLAAGSEQKTVTLPELGIQLDTAATLRDALAIGHEGSLPQRIWQSAQARQGQSTLVRPAFTLDESKANAIVQSMAASFNQPPIDATASWRDGRVVITPGHSEEVLDTSSAITQIKQSVLAPLNNRQEPITQLTLPSEEKQPRVTTEALQQVDTLLGSYSTSYASSSSNRVNNVLEAAKALNNFIVMPGETFSFNKAVGPRSEDTGFLEAPVIVNGKMETGIGGGICQVSTTLYNAVLLANLKIVTRNHHSLPSHYVPTGLDATVSYGSLDFCFSNSSTAPVVIESSHSAGRLQMQVLGKGPAPQVKIERDDIKALPTRTETINDPTLPQGKRLVKRGRPTKEVTVYRVVDGQRELLSHDRYPGEPTIIRVGTGPTKAPAIAIPGATLPTLLLHPPVSTPPHAGNITKPNAKPMNKPKANMPNKPKGKTAVKLTVKPKQWTPAKTKPPLVDHRNDLGR